MALNMSMKQVLSVQPVKHFQKTASRFEGLLLRVRIKDEFFIITLHFYKKFVLLKIQDGPKNLNK